MMTNKMERKNVSPSDALRGKFEDGSDSYADDWCVQEQVSKLDCSCHCPYCCAAYWKCTCARNKSALPSFNTAGWRAFGFFSVFVLLFAILYLPVARAEEIGVPGGLLHRADEPWYRDFRSDPRIVQIDRILSKYRDSDWSTQVLREERSQIEDWYAANANTPDDEGECNHAMPFRFGRDCPLTRGKWTVSFTGADFLWGTTDNRACEYLDVLRARCSSYHVRQFYENSFLEQRFVAPTCALIAGRVFMNSTFWADFCVSYKTIGNNIGSPRYEEVRFKCLSMFHDYLVLGKALTVTVLPQVQSPIPNVTIHVNETINDTKVHLAPWVKFLQLYYNFNVWVLNSSSSFSPIIETLVDHGVNWQSWIVWLVFLTGLMLAPWMPIMGKGLSAAVSPPGIAGYILTCSTDFSWLFNAILTIFRLLGFLQVLCWVLGIAAYPGVWQWVNLYVAIVLFSWNATGHLFLGNVVNWFLYSVELTIFIWFYFIGTAIFNLKIYEYPSHSMTFTMVIYSICVIVAIYRFTNRVKMYREMTISGADVDPLDAPRRQSSKEIVETSLHAWLLVSLFSLRWVPTYFSPVIIGDAPGGIVKKLETFVRGSSWLRLDVLGAVAKLYREDGSYSGTVFNLGTCLCTATHNLSSDARHNGPIRDYLMLKDNKYSLSVLKIQGDMTFFKSLNLSARDWPIVSPSTVGQEVSKDNTVHAFCVSFPANLAMGIVSQGLWKQDGMHWCGTDDGSSGAPLIINNRVVGIHTAGGHDENYFLNFTDDDVRFIRNPSLKQETIMGFKRETSGQFKPKMSEKRQYEIQFRNCLRPFIKEWVADHYANKVMPESAQFEKSAEFQDLMDDLRKEYPEYAEQTEMLRDFAMEIWQDNFKTKHDQKVYDIQNRHDRSGKQKGGSNKRREQDVNQPVLDRKVVTFNKSDETAIKGKEKEADLSVEYVKLNGKVDALLALINRQCEIVNRNVESVSKLESAFDRQRNAPPPPSNPPMPHMPQPEVRTTSVVLSRSKKRREKRKENAQKQIKGKFETKQAPQPVQETAVKVQESAPVTIAKVDEALAQKRQPRQYQRREPYAVRVMTCYDDCMALDVNSPDINESLKRTFERNGIGPETLNDFKKRAPFAQKFHNVVFHRDGATSSQ